jgi:TonB family protein
MRLFVVCLAIGAVLRASAAPEPSPFPPQGTLRSYFSYMPPPEYPEAVRRDRRGGKGWFELEIDRPSGHVRQVRVLKSTGVQLLDDFVVARLRQWRAKSGLIHRAVIPVEFHHG